MYLPDVNVWVALSIKTHKHHHVATAWYTQYYQHGLSFCRMTQQGLLRILTSSQILGSAALTMTDAWQVYDQFMAYQNFHFLFEPKELETNWRALTQKPTHSTHLWNDAYLAAFATLTGLQIVTFDTAFQQ